MFKERCDWPLYLRSIFIQYIRHFQCKLETHMNSDRGSGRYSLSKYKDFQPYHGKKPQDHYCERLFLSWAAKNCCTFQCTMETYLNWKNDVRGTWQYAIHITWTCSTHDHAPYLGTAKQRRDLLSAGSYSFTKWELSMDHWKCAV
jgi:hypothetical protein